MQSKQEFSSIAAKFTQEVQPLLEDIGKTAEDLSINEWVDCFERFILEGLTNKVATCREAYENHDNFADKDASGIDFGLVEMFLEDRYWPSWRKCEEIEKYGARYQQVR